MTPVVQIQYALFTRLGSPAMVITMKEHLKAVLSVLCVMILIPELLLISEGEMENITLQSVNFFLL